MSNPALHLAEQIISQPVQNGDATERLASALLEANRDVLAMHERYAALHKQYNAAIHERDELREKLGRAAPGRVEPAFARYCANVNCRASIVRSVPPPEEAVETWMRGLGWSEDGHCPACKEQP